MIGMGETFQYGIDHVSRYHYSLPSRRCSMSLCLKPRQGPNQRLISFDVETEPPVSLHQEVDCFGNVKYNLNIYREHAYLRIAARSLISKTRHAPLPDGIGRKAWEEIGHWKKSIDGWDFLLPSALSRPSPALEAFVRRHGIKPNPDDPLISLKGLSDAIYRIFEYRPGSTSTASPIDHILETGRGVCQDYAHVMIAIARMWDIPARYVMGYFYDAGRTDGAEEHTTHAWVECRLPQLGWVGFDPTNQSLPDERHISVAVGRDFQDVSPTRGVRYGGGESQLDIDVRMWIP